MSNLECVFSKREAADGAQRVQELSARAAVERVAMSCEFSCVF